MLGALARYFQKIVKHGPADEKLLRTDYRRMSLASGADFTEFSKWGESRDPEP